MRLGARTDLTALNLTDDTRQIAVKIGVATFEIRRLDQTEIWEVDTPNSAVTLEEAGRYTVQVDQDGNSRVSVARGAASVAAGGGQVPVNAGQVMKIDESTHLATTSSRSGRPTGGTNGTSNGRAGWLTPARPSLLARTSSVLTIETASIDPNFDPLRKNPRFQKLVAGGK